MPKPIFLSIRDAKGRMFSVNPFDIRADLPDDVKAQAVSLIHAIGLLPKRGRGCPKGYRPSPESVTRSVEGRAATRARKLAQQAQDC